MDDRKCPEIEIVLIGICGQLIQLPCQSLKKDSYVPLPQLDLNLEEADMRLMPRGIHAAHAGAKRLIILS